MNCVRYCTLLVVALACSCILSLPALADGSWVTRAKEAPDIRIKCRKEQNDKSTKSFHFQGLEVAILRDVQFAVTSLSLSDVRDKNGKRTFTTWRGLECAHLNGCAVTDPTVIGMLAISTDVLLLTSDLAVTKVIQLTAHFTTCAKYGDLSCLSSVKPDVLLHRVELTCEMQESGQFDF